MSTTNGPQAPFHVVCSSAIANAIRQLYHQVVPLGLSHEFLTVLRQIFEQLRLTPLELGEPLRRLR